MGSNIIEKKMIYFFVIQFRLALPNVQVCLKQYQILVKKMWKWSNNC